MSLLQKNAMQLKHAQMGLYNLGLRAFDLICPQVSDFQTAEANGDVGYREDEEQQVINSVKCRQFHYKRKIYKYSQN